MNRILAIDTSTTRASLALVEGEAVIYEPQYRSSRSHNSELFEPLSKILKEAPALDGLVVGIGPGSYTGIRISIAATLAIAMARELPILPIPSVHALWGDVLDNSTNRLRPFAVLGDARRGNYFHGMVDPSNARFTPIVDSLEQVTEAAHNYRAKEVPLLVLEEKARAVVPEASFGTIALAEAPQASRLAQAVATLSAESIEEAIATELLPIYLQAPFTTTPKKKSPPSSI